jgi:hypothetical protein
MRSLRSLPGHEAAFIEPMECLAVPKLPDGPGWVYEIKLDGYRALAFNSDRKLGLSRKRKGFHRQYVHIFDALSELPPNTVLDGEIVALDDAGRPNFNLLQCFRAKASRVCYFVFDLLVYQGRDLTQLALVDRREILKTKLQFQSALIRIAQCFAPKRPRAEFGNSGGQVEGQPLRGREEKRIVGEGRLNAGQELVIGGYVPGAHGLDSVIVGYQRIKTDLRCARPKWICASDAEAGVHKTTAVGYAVLSVCQSARNTQRPLGNRTNRR